MQQIGELSGPLNCHFNWNKARMDCFVGMLVALLKLRSVNLTELAAAFPSSAKPESRYRRIQRFIGGYALNFDSVAGFVMGLFGFQETDYDLTLDRTNWQWGEKNINILMLAVAYKGIAIPVYWVLLNKQGNSSTRERFALLKRFIKHFGQERVRALLADREFIGEAWLKGLKEAEIDFVIRIKKNSKVPTSQDKLVQVKTLFRFLKPGEQFTVAGSKQMTGVAVYLTGLRLSDGELLILAAGQQRDDAVEAYKERWQIETLFACLKGRGFNLEDTHVTDRLHIKRLLVVPVIAFCWAHRTGEWQHTHVKPIKVKKHRRLTKSIFRTGLNFIRDALLNVDLPLQSALRALRQFIDFKRPCGDG